jgi:hypothetical protein
MPTVRNIIQKNFSIVSEDDRIESFEVSSFEYMSVHFIVQLKEVYSGPRYDALKGISFEIQLRTILMDAWANVSHYLDYKGETSIPSELRRDFYALSGLFYVADKHFELFFAESRASRQQAKASISGATPNLRQELNLDTMLAYLQERLPERKRSSPDEISELLEELKRADFRSLHEVDEKIASGLSLYEEFEASLGIRNLSLDVGAVRGALSLTDKHFREVFWGRYGALRHQAWVDLAALRSGEFVT